MSIELRDLFIFLKVQSHQVKVGVREARHILEPVTVGIGYLKISEFVVVESFDRFIDNTI